MLSINNASLCCVEVVSRIGGENVSFQSVIITYNYSKVEVSFSSKVERLFV